MGLRDSLQRLMASTVSLRILGPLVMLLSGFAGLGYQIVWTERAALLLGHESAAVLAVVTAFFGGLALGGSNLGRRVEESARPRRWYVAAELLIAIWSLLLIPLWRPAGELVLRLTGTEAAPGWQWLVSFAATFVLLAPATVAMGVTLPAMERLLAERVQERRSLSALYAYNTLGAVLGVVVTAGWSLAELGLSRTVWLCAACNLLCAATARAAFPRSIPRQAAPRLSLRRELHVGFRLAVTGLLGIGYEVVVVRVLSQVTEDTVYTFASLLVVYLLGSAAGAGAYRRWLENRDIEQLGHRLLAALAGACLLGALSLWEAERIHAWARLWLGPGWTRAVLEEALLALAAFGLPTFVMGAQFSHLTRHAHQSGLSFGRALGLNTMAGAAAPVVFGVLLVPLAGPKHALLLIVVGYLLLLPQTAWYRVGALPAAGVLATGLLMPPLRFVDVPAGGHIVSYTEGVTAAVSVVEDADGVAQLRIDNRQQEGSSASLRVDARQAWLPLLLHPAPQRALFLGLGTGVTAASAAADPTLRVDAVELLPEVIAASTRFADGPARARLHVIAADARRFVRGSRERYDVIVADNFHPARAGTAALYTVEHFEAVRDRLATGGVFCQWLPLHQLDLETLRSVTQSFLRVYPRALAILASSSLETPVFGLVTHHGDPRFDLEATRDHLQHLALAEQVFRLGLEDEYAVLGAFVADSGALRRFAGSSPLNTDDRPLVAYRAPRVTYAPDSSPAERLLRLLAELSAEPSQVVRSVDPAQQQRLADYWRARDQFITSGQNIEPSGKVREMLAQVQEPLLAVLRISPDFRPAYDPLLAMASALARSDAVSARPLLKELSRLQPSRADAAQLLAMLDRSEPR